MTIENSAENKPLRRSDREINKIRRKFARIVRDLPPMGQDLVTDMTSILSERDKYAEFKSDAHNIEEFSSELGQMGVDEKKIQTIMRFFNLPYEKK